jgi:hypothetical protein
LVPRELADVLFEWTKTLVTEDTYGHAMFWQRIRKRISESERRVEEAEKKDVPKRVATAESKATLARRRRRLDRKGE